MIKSKAIRLLFLKDNFLLLFSLVWLWFSISLWVDSHHSENSLQAHYGTVTDLDSVIISVKDKPLFKQITKLLRITLSTDENKPFTYVATENFGKIISQIAIGDSVTLFTRPKVWGIFGLKNNSDINQLIKNGSVVINYNDYTKKISGMFYLTMPAAIIFFLVYTIRLRKRLWLDFGGYEKYRETNRS